MHEYLCFEEDDRTWMFDITFLLSSWTCIFGSTCKGLMTGDATHLMQGCCSYGAHFISDDDIANVEQHAARLDDSVWQFAGEARRYGWLAPEGERGEHRATRLAEDACIFLNRPGFEGGVGCALHHGAVAAGERPMDWKPTVCWQVPLRLSESVDTRDRITVTLREWKRRDWGAGGDEFHWWCTDSHEAFVGKDPVYVYLRDEITELIGERMYNKLATELDRRRTTTFLPHPKVKR